MLARRRMSLRASTEDTGGRPMGNVRVIDGDGHIFEDAEAISSYLPSPYREAGPYPMTKLIPAVDHLHTQIGKLLPGAFAGGKHVGPEEWIAFLGQVGIESTVLYPTGALGYGRMVDLDWSVAVCRAYNDWLSDTYVRRDPRFHGMALVPLQEPDEAVKELRRAVTELGLSGAFLPSNGLPLALGSKPYWPLYAEAEKLGCSLAVHGGNHSGYGMDHFNVYAPVHSLGHPFGQLVSFASIVFNGIFDKYPGVRVAFLEGGIAWLLLALERFDRSHETHIPYDPRGEVKARDPGGAGGRRPDRGPEGRHPAQERGAVLPLRRDLVWRGSPHGGH